MTATFTVVVRERAPIRCQQQARGHAQTKLLNVENHQWHRQFELTDKCTESHDDAIIRDRPHADNA